MANFKKYNSLTNHYVGKYLNKVPPDWKNIRYCGTEKYDGSNTQLYFQPQELCRVGMRNGWKDDQSHFGIDEFLPNYGSEILYLKVLSDNMNKTIRVFCEFYGIGINGRIDYGASKYLKAFDVMINDVLLTQDEVDTFVANSNGILDNFFVKPIVFNNLLEALAYDVESHKFDANLGKERPIEGIVIKPYDDLLFFKNDERFIIKKKSIAFADQMKANSAGLKCKEFSPELLNAAEEFKRYITKNRMIDLFSKRGPIQEAKQMGDYIKWYIEDAKEDFLKEHDISTFDQKAQKDLFNVGRVVADMLRESIGGTFRT